MILHVLNMYNHFKLDIIYKKKNKTFSNIIMILPNLPSYIRFKSKLELINTVKKENTSYSKMNYPYRKTNHKGMRNKKEMTSSFTDSTDEIISIP